MFDLNIDPAGIGPATSRNLHFTPKSASIGLIQDLPWDLVASITGQYVERAPKPAELFSRGGHEATATFDIGNPNLGIETAKSIEVGLRRATGPLRFEVTGYYTKVQWLHIPSPDRQYLRGGGLRGCGRPGPARTERRRSTRSATRLSAAAEFQSQLDVGPF